MSSINEATAMTPCLAPDEDGLAPIDKSGLDALITKGKENPQAIKTLKCKTVAEGKFRHLNYIRDLPLILWMNRQRFLVMTQLQTLQKRL